MCSVVILCKLLSIITRYIMLSIFLLNVIILVPTDQFLLFTDLQFTIIFYFILFSSLFLYDVLKNLHPIILFIVLQTSEFGNWNFIDLNVILIVNT